MRPRSGGAGCADKDTKAVRSTKTQRPQRMRRTELKFTVLRRPCGLLTVADLDGLSSPAVLCVLWSPSVSLSLSSLERETEHDLRDPLEPGLRAGGAEIGVADGVPAVQRPHIDTVQQVQ